MKKLSGIIISAVITLIIAAIMFYVTLPAVNIHFFGFYVFLFIVIAIFAVLATGFTLVGKGTKLHIVPKAAFVCLGLIIVVVIFGVVTSLTIFNSKDYVERITIENGNFDADVATLSDIKKIPLMDTASASILGDRVVGSLTDLVSQYNVSDTYTTIYYQGKVVKVAPLEYAGFFKYNNNKKEGIPGYVLVDTETNEAQFVRLEEGIQYDSSAYFSKDLNRTLRMKYPTLSFGDYSFQIDEDGKPYWVVSVLKYNTFFGCTVPSQAVILDAVTGEMEFYNIAELPEWVDYVYSGETICELYNQYGILQDGFINSIIGQKGCTMTTDDFGYVAMNDDIYVYTGITSIVSDKSNLGFLLVNSRTGEFRYYEQDGAEEHSAMDAAEGVVQNYGYVASFPALININGEPTYAMVLKDSKGLVKQYSMVNVKNYTIVAVGDTMSDTLKNYKNAMASAGKGVDITLDIDYEEKDIVITDIEFVTSNQLTVVYIKSDEKVYKQNFDDNEGLILLNVGDTITVQYDKEDEENSIIEISGFTVAGENTEADEKSEEETTIQSETAAQ